MELKKELLDNISKIHTTELGVDRIRKNLSLDDGDSVKHCLDIIKKEDSKVHRKGKNYYVTYKGTEITVNASTYTIITAHKK